jgi:hypothetical protein
MRKIGIAGVTLGLLTTALTSTVWAIKISPNDDTYVQANNAGANFDNPTQGAPLSTGGLLMKNQTGQQRVSFIEYTIPNVPATSATFNATYFRSWTAGTSWTFRLLGVTTSFDETTLNFTNYQGTALQNGPFTTLTTPDLNMPGGNSGQDVVPPVAIVVDITSFFNANLGQTVVFRCVSTSSASNGNAGGSFEDRELSRTGNPNYAPFIDYVPEPATLLLLLAALPMLRRRTECTA